jgi:hypothetical protein
MAGELIGRQQECGAVEEFLDAVATGSGSLLLEGEAGIGKTRLWEVAVAAARRRGYEVLVASPGHAEVQLAFAVLGDLLADFAPAAFDVLPDPQRRALEIALLIAEGDGPRSIRG